MSQWPTDLLHLASSSSIVFKIFHQNRPGRAKLSFKKISRGFKRTLPHSTEQCQSFYTVLKPDCMSFVPLVFKLYFKRVKISKRL